MARCGCSEFGSCNCLVTGKGAVTVTGTGGQSDPYVVHGPILFPQDTYSFDVTLTGDGSSSSPWRISVQPRKYATVERPSATDAGDGSMIYDTDINKPLWSDGTTWRDATGAAA